ncbi:MAG: ABC transporter permease [Chloroflexi bacterium]|nr:ABC transporter permease [Chloroflexota bacterium]
MKLWSVFVKSMREQVRDIWTLLLTLSSAPFFVLIYYLLFGGGSTTYSVLVINEDVGTIAADGTEWHAGDDIVAALENNVTYEDGQSMLDVALASDRDQAETRLKDRDAALLLVIPEGFSQALADGDAPPPAITLVGDLTNTYYSVASVMASAAITGYVDTLGTEPHGIQLNEEALGASAARTEFETYVPGLLLFSVLLLIYQTSMVIAREIEAGTLRRLQITRLSAFGLLGGVSLSQLVIGLLCIITTFLVAVALGFHSEGPIIAAVFISLVTAFSAVGVGLMVACFSKTVIRAFIVSTFPLFLMMFFTGVFLPVGSVPLFEISGREVALFDALPPTQAVVALNKILTLGEGLGGVVYEVAVALGLSLVYFLAGVGLFHRMHLRRA